MNDPATLPKGPFTPNAGPAPVTEALPTVEQMKLGRRGFRRPLRAFNRAATALAAQRTIRWLETQALGD